jgi:two-component system, response regulator PdtaR
MNLQQATIYFMSRDHLGGTSLPAGRKGAAEQLETAARILVVEDEYFVALTIEDALVDAGHEVVGVVTSGEAAIDAANTLQPELVLMDIRLAGEMTGIDAALELRRRGFPSIFASAHSDEAMKEAGGKAKPAGWLVKPFSHAELVTAVKAALVRIRSN